LAARGPDAATRSGTHGKDGSSDPTWRIRAGDRALLRRGRWARGDGHRLDVPRRDVRGDPARLHRVHRHAAARAHPWPRGSAVHLRQMGNGMSEQDGTKRFYGVTSITKLGMGTGYALVEWNARMPAETAYDRFKTLSAYVSDGDRKGAVKWLMGSRYAESGAA